MWLVWLPWEQILEESNWLSALPLISCHQALSILFPKGVSDPLSPPHPTATLA